MADPAVLPRRLRILNAVKAEIAAIVAGDPYWFKPAEVGIGFKTWDECTSYPAYFVSAGSGGPTPSLPKDRNWLRHVQISIKGNVHSPTDSAAAIIKAVHDVETAVFADRTHGGLGMDTTLDAEPDTDDGYLAPYGFFDLRITVSYYESY